MEFIRKQPTDKASGDTFTGDAWYGESEWGEEVSDVEYLAATAERSR